MGKRLKPPGECAPVMNLLTNCALCGAQLALSFQRKKPRYLPCTCTEATSAAHRISDADKTIIARLNAQRLDAVEVRRA